MGEESLTSKLDGIDRWLLQQVQSRYGKTAEVEGPQRLDRAYWWRIDAVGHGLLFVGISERALAERDSRWITRSLVDGHFLDRAEEASSERSPLGALLLRGGSLRHWAPA